MNDAMSGTKRWPHRRNLKREAEMQQKLQEKVETEPKWKLKAKKVIMKSSIWPRSMLVVNTRWFAYPPGKTNPIGRHFESVAEAHDFINLYWDVWN